MGGISPCFAMCGDPACRRLGCVRVFNSEHRYDETDTQPALLPDAVPWEHDPAAVLPDAAAAVVAAEPARLGLYLGVQVVVVGTRGLLLVCLWPDVEHPKKRKPWTYRKGEWWLLLPGQVRITHTLPGPVLHPPLKPKPLPVHS